jgi:hypothetical protein
MRHASPLPGFARRHAARTIALLFAGALASATAAAAQAPPAAQPSERARPRRVDARTEEIMKKMSAFLAQAQRFALEAEEALDEVSDNAPRLQLSNVRRIAVVRPDRFAADATGDTLNRVAVYDGRTLSLLDKARNAYVTAAAPSTLDAALDAAAEKLGLVFPLGDLVYSDPYSVLMEGVLYGEYRGIHQAAGVACHHLAFTQEAIEWQIWIEAGDEPLPRKLLIATWTSPACRSTPPPSGAGT